MVSGIDKNAGTGDGPAGDDNGPVPVMQAVLDNPFLLLFIGVAIPTVSYLIWGIIDIVLIPIGK